MFRVLLLSLLLVNTAFADDHAKDKDQVAGEEAGALCSGFGPQTPRDIDQKMGKNKVTFPIAESTENMNLCNIHFHRNAEHKAAAFSKLEDDDPTKGYQCGLSETLSEAELAQTEGEVCKGLKPGDTVEVHWVHSSCDVSPGAGLGACLSDACANPSLRVETQVFTLVHDTSALNFSDFDYKAKSPQGYHAASWPTDTGVPVEFTGSTTGPKYTTQSCSPLQVGWSVRPQCAKLDINSLGAWCKDNKFSEDHAHKVRKLVTELELLSPIGE